MTLAALIPLLVKISIALTVIGLGLKARLEDAMYLFGRPSLLVRSLASMNVIMPMFAAAAAAVFQIHPAVKIALVTLALSPVPPILPKKEMKAGGRVSYVIGLLVAAALFAILFIPLALEVLGRLFDRELGIPAAVVAKTVLISILVPLAVGITVRHLAPAWAERMANPTSLVGMVLLVASALPMMFTAWPAVMSLIGNGTILAIAAFVILGLATGQALGGPRPEDRTDLALATASRHPGLAMAIATINFPRQKLVFGAIFLYLIVNLIVTLPYLKWRKRQA